MAFSLNKLSGNIGVGSFAPVVFTFADTDSTRAEVAAADYFLDAYKKLNVGDGIYCLCSDGAIILRVATSTSSGVTTALLDTTTV